MFHTSLIYKLLAIHILVHEANQAIDLLRLPQAPITNLHACRVEARAPRQAHGKIVGLVGSVRTEGLALGRHAGSGFYFLAIDQVKGWHGDNWDGATAPRGTLKQSDAYDLACGWLEALGVDVGAMGKTFPPKTTHIAVPLREKGVMSARYHVRWAPKREKFDETAAEVYVNLAKRTPVRIYVVGTNFLTAPLPEVPNGVALNALPDEPVVALMRSLEDPLTQYTNVFKLLEIPPGWREAHAPGLIEQADRVVSVLGWKAADQKFSELATDVYVNPPAFGLGGRVMSSAGEVIIGAKGKLKYFQQWPLGATNFYQWLSHAPCIIGTNEARQIGEQRLAALGFDLQRLSRDFVESVAQPLTRIYVKGRGRLVPGPAFELTWERPPKDGAPRIPMVRVQVYGDSRRVGVIEVEDDSYLGDPAGPPAARAGAGDE